ncbi:MAG: DUF4143 domain-containing protein [Desulfobacterales bacterium]|nr:DUF4143 domain-containing protein [Desulfobacterales bacterium]
MRFDLSEALTIGLLPAVMNSPDPLAALHAYVDLYLKEEVQMEGLTRNIGNFSRFLEAASFSHGSVTLNISNIARECRIERKVVEGYIGILEDLLLGIQGTCFHTPGAAGRLRHIRNSISSAPVSSPSCGLRVLLTGPKRNRGAALEGLVAQHLQAWIDYRHPDCRLRHWRTKAGSEVDFVVAWQRPVPGHRGEELGHRSSAGPEGPQDIRTEITLGAERVLVYRGKRKATQRRDASGTLCGVSSWSSQ